MASTVETQKTPELDNIVDFFTKSLKDDKVDRAEELLMDLWKHFNTIQQHTFKLKEQAMKGDTPKKKKSPAKNKETHKCNGKTAKGEPCSKNGKEQSDSGNWYCGTHFKNYQKFEPVEVEENNSDSE